MAAPRAWTSSSTILFSAPVNCQACFEATGVKLPRLTSLAWRATDRGGAFHRSLRISYSEFFRDPLTFALLERTFLAGLVPNKGEADRTAPRIGPPGGAEGQEAWSVAFLLDAPAAARGSQSTVRVLRNRPFRSQHRSGACWALFRAALGNVRLRHLDTYFSRKAIYTSWPTPRERVDFAVYDLLDERLPVLLRAFLAI